MAGDDRAWPTLEELEAQEQRLVLPHPGLAALYDLGRRMADTALERQLPVLIQVRRGSRLVFVASLPGSTRLERPVGGAEVAARRVVRAELAAGRRRASRRNGLDVHARHALPVEEFAAHGGAFPLTIRGIGVVGTSSSRGCRSSRTTRSSSTCSRRTSRVPRARLGSMPSPRFTMVVLNVADLARSAAFYRRLGVTFPDDVKRPARCRRRPRRRAPPGPRDNKLGRTYAGTCRPTGRRPATVA